MSAWSSGERSIRCGITPWPRHPSEAATAIGGVFGDLIGIRAVYLTAARLVMIAAGISLVLFRGAPARPGIPSVPEAEAA